MTITAEQRLARRHSIGSSDSPAIMGLDSYRTAADVYAEKVYELTDGESSEQIEIGNEFEAPLAQWAARELGVDLQTNVSLQREIQATPFGANLDALVVGKPQTIECKTGSGEGYGEPGSDQVPERVIIQAHHAMLVGDYELVWIPALLARRDHLERAMYKVTRNETLIDLVRESGTAFWHDHVLPKKAPEIVPPSLEVLKRIRRQPKSVAFIPPELVEAFEAAQLAAKNARLTEEEAKARLLAALGDSEAADYGDPHHIWTYYERSRKAYEIKAATFRVLQKVRK